nr:ABC transporter substrate-binding protein [Rhodococcus wratislaviensis]
MRTLDRRKFLTVSAGVGLADATWPWAQDALGGTHPEVFNRGQFTCEAVSRTRRTFYVRSPNDPRSRLMTSLGFVVPEQIAQLAGDQDAFTISKEQFDIVDVDVLVWNVGSSPGAEAQITADPVYQSLPVAKAGRAVFVDDPTVSGALTWGTVLSLPYAVEALVPKLADAAAKPA